MIIKKVLYPDRLRKITGSFAFIEHRFLQAGFWNALSLRIPLKVTTHSGTL